MKCIRILKDEDFNLESVEFNNPKIRIGARGIVKRDDGKIALFNKVNKNEYKLPGGGVEDGEKPIDGFLREVMEEVGCTVEIEEELGTIEEHKTLDNFKQISYIFVAKVLKEGNELSLDQKEIDEGGRLIWVDAREGLKLITECFDNLKASKYENLYRSRFISLRDRTILEYYLNNFS